MKNDKQPIDRIEQRQVRWQPTALLISHLAAAVLLLSWLIEPGRSLWLAFDDIGFWWFNNSLANGSDGWRYFWALTNMQEFDLLVAILLLGIFVLHAIRSPRSQLGRQAGIFFAMLVVLGIWTGYGNHTGLGQLLPIERPSGTLEYNDSFRLAHWSTDIKTKDASTDTFPGDHGMILLVVAGFIGYYFSRGYMIFAIVVAIAGTLPRVVAGAHWISDELVGAVVIGVLALSWNFHTPAGEYLVRMIDWPYRKLFNYRNQ